MLLNITFNIINIVLITNFMVRLCLAGLVMLMVGRPAQYWRSLCPSPPYLWPLPMLLTTEHRGPHCPVTRPVHRRRPVPGTCDWRRWNLPRLRHLRRSLSPGESNIFPVSTLDKFDKFILKRSLLLVSSSSLNVEYQVKKSVCLPLLLEYSAYYWT